MSALEIGVSVEVWQWQTRKGEQECQVQQCLFFKQRKTHQNAWVEGIESVMEKDIGSYECWREPGDRGKDQRTKEGIQTWKVCQILGQWVMSWIDVSWWPRGVELEGDEHSTEICNRRDEDRSRTDLCILQTACLWNGGKTLATSNLVACSMTLGLQGGEW